MCTQVKASILKMCVCVRVCVFQPNAVTGSDLVAHTQVCFGVRVPVNCTQAAVKHFKDHSVFQTCLKCYLFIFSLVFALVSYPLKTFEFFPPNTSDFSLLCTGVLTVPAINPELYAVTEKSLPDKCGLPLIKKIR